MIPAAVSHEPPTRIYAPVASGALRQGELVVDLKQGVLDIAALRDGRHIVDTVTRSFALVVTQDCDLEQDYSSGKRVLSVLFCIAQTAEATRASSPDFKSTGWKRVVQNKEMRFHFLQGPIPAEDNAAEGLPDLVVDFKSYFALPRDEAYFRIEQLRRRCALVSPYVEHLSTRFAHYLARVALPVDHAETQQPTL
jgi:hypothetical protein